MCCFRIFTMPIYADEIIIKMRLYIEENSLDIQTNVSIKPYWKDNSLSEIEILIYAKHKLCVDVYKNMFKKVLDKEPTMIEDFSSIELCNYGNITEENRFFSTLYIPKSLIEST